MKMLHKETTHEVPIVSNTLRVLAAAIQKEAWVLDSAQSEVLYLASEGTASLGIGIVRTLQLGHTAGAFLQPNIHQVRIEKHIDPLTVA